MNKYEMASPPLLATNRERIAGINQQVVHIHQQVRERQQKIRSRFDKCVLRIDFLLEIIDNAKVIWEVP